MKRIYILLVTLSFAILSNFAVAAQDIVTADQFFAKVSDRYSTIDDYEAAIAISNGSQPMAGKLYFKSPSLLRIDFSQPPEQVIVFDGERLVVYIPQYRAVLQQETGTAGLGAGAASLASREGLVMMKRNYTIAWETSPSRFLSIKVRLRWYTSCCLRARQSPKDSRRCGFRFRNPVS